MVDELEQKCEKAAQSHQELDTNDNIVNDTIQAGQGQGLWQGEPGQHKASRASMRELRPANGFIRAENFQIKQTLQPLDLQVAHAGRARQSSELLIVSDPRA